MGEMLKRGRWKSSLAGMVFAEVKDEKHIFNIFDLYSSRLVGRVYDTPD